MSMSNIKTAEPTTINTCQNHTQGDGRECAWYADSEYYDVNTLEGNVTVTNQ